MLALSLSDKLCYFGIFIFVFDFFVFVFNRFLFFRFSFVFVFIIFSFSFSLTNSLFSRFSTFSFSFSLTKITLLWTDLYETLTHVVYQSGIEHYEEILWVSAPKKSGAQKLPILDDFIFKIFLYLNGSLQNCNTWRVWVGNRTLRRYF